MWWGRIILLGKFFNTAVNSAEKKMYLVLIVGELYTFFIYLDFNNYYFGVKFLIQYFQNIFCYLSTIHFFKWIISSMCSSERVQLKIDIFRFVKQTLALWLSLRGTVYHFRQWKIRKKQQSCAACVVVRTGTTYLQMRKRKLFTNSRADLRGELYCLQTENFFFLRVKMQSSPGGY